MDKREKQTNVISECKASRMSKKDASALRQGPDLAWEQEKGKDEFVLFCINTLHLNPNTHIGTQTPKVSTARSSSLSHSGGLSNPYCLFFENSCLISPQDRS